jgi:hypothetical protein
MAMIAITTSNSIKANAERTTFTAASPYCGLAGCVSWRRTLL